MIARIILLFVLFIAVPAQAKVLDVQQVTSSGGLSIWLVEDHSVPVVSLNFAFLGAGGINDPADKQGLSQLLSNTMDEGAGEIDAETFQGILRDRAIELSFFSTRDDFGGSVRTLTRHQDKAFELLQLALTAPRFDKEAVDRMVAANVARIRSNLSDPSWLAARLLNDAMFKDHPYGQNSGGTVATLTGITPDDLRAAFKARYARANLVIAIAGDIEPDAAAALADKVFSGLPAKAAETSAIPAGFPENGDIVFYRQDIPQTMISVAWPGIDIHDRDYYAAVVMNHIFGGGGFGSRIMDEIREKRGLSYGIYSGLIHYTKADRMNVSGSTRAADTGQVLSLLRQSAEGMTSNPPTQKDIDDARDYLVGSLPIGFSSTENIAAAVLGLRIDDLGVDGFDKYVAGINAVTPADVARVAARVFAAKPVVALVGPMPPQKAEGVDGARVVTKIPNALESTP